MQILKFILKFKYNNNNLFSYNDYFLYNKLYILYWIQARDIILLKLRIKCNYKDGIIKWKYTFTHRCNIFLLYTVCYAHPLQRGEKSED